ncbi:MAG: hypothetical protein AAF721_42565 [Myxococcota bacterium]
MVACSGAEGSVADDGTTHAEAGATTGSSGGPSSGWNVASSSGGEGDGESDGVSEADGSGEASSGDTTGASAECPHPLYPGLDLCALPGDGGGACGAYESPALPTTTRTVTIQSTGAQAATDLIAACETPGTAVDVPNGAGRIGVVTLGGFEDCDITLGLDVTVDALVFGLQPGPTPLPSTRIRVRGGKIGSVSSNANSSDLVLDGVMIDNGALPLAERGGSGVVLHGDGDDGVERFAVVNSIVRAVDAPPDENGATHGIAYLGARARDVLFANNNIVTVGNLNSWGFRVGGGCNTLIVDNTTRVSFHKLVRINDADTDYVYIRGGTWMREATVSPFGGEINDSFKELNGDWSTDNVYIHDTAVYLLSGQPVTFGAAANEGNVGHLWEARGIEWHVVDESVISDAGLEDREASCTPGALCDYGIGTHTYAYDPALSFPTDAWRELPELPVSDPDMLPLAR